MLKNILLIVKGFIVGGTMLVPGVSGGSMAMILGIYDSLISSISSFMKHKRKSLVTLLLFGVGAISGLILFAGPLESLLKKYPLFLMYFFIGAIAGSIPMILKKARVKNKSGRQIFLYCPIGITAVTLLSLLPTGLFTSNQNSFSYYLLLFAAGIVVAIGLVLPGISTSHMLLLLGLYDPVINALESHKLSQMLTLSPLILGLLIGIVLTTKFLEKAISTQPQATYLIILGFLLGSVINVFPGLPHRWEIIICALLLLSGFLIIYKLSGIEEEQNTEPE